MKIFTQGIRPRRKIIVIFLLGLFIPSLCVGYLSWNAFSKRREALRQVIESQLWISGETALESIESALLKYEETVMNPENFAPLFSSLENQQEINKPPSFSKERIFLLDSDFRILFPQAGGENIPLLHQGLSLSDSPFASLFQRAEFLEFDRKEHEQAAELYLRCSLSTPVKQLRAYALERRAVCLVELERYDEASRIYWNFLDEFSQFKNRMGHPYSILAVLQLANIIPAEQMERAFFAASIDVLEKLRSGEWQLNNSAYVYFSQAIEYNLKRELVAEKFPEIVQAYRTLLDKPSPYLDELEFNLLLEENVIPLLKDRIAFSLYSNESQKGRFPVTEGDADSLISYSNIVDPSSNRSYYSGFSWDLDSMKNQMLPEMAKTLESTSGIQVRLIDNHIPNGEPDTQTVIPADSLSITFRQFPFPWRLIVTQTALENLKSSALKENIIYGVLLAVVVALMGLGALLLVRDMSREMETTRHKSEFVHNISHELKTPLTLIRLYGETLKDQKDLPDKERKKAYEIITRESERLSYMINNVLDFSRIELGKKEFNLKSGRLADLIGETLELYLPHLEKKGFTVSREIENSLPPMNFDREALASLLINLLSNSMKFSPETKEVSVRLFQRGNDAVLQVEDKGIGISPKEADKIFQRFFRSQNVAVSGSTGSGLGLTIVKFIAEAHGGRIEVESEEGKGSLFSVILPLSGPEEDKK
jgi:signal transduction histidine kinase